MTGAATVIPVAGAVPYDVVVGRDLLSRVPAALGEPCRVTVVHPRAMTGLAGSMTAALRGAGFDAEALVVPDGEAAKELSVAGGCWDAMAARSMTRNDAVVGLGGGAATDLAGFVAACWLRGVRVVQVPTTLLAMVDAAVGGKTGINVAAGKNLVGAFHPPAAVVCDLDLLRTLPAVELASGMAEVVKAGFIADPAILDLVEADPAAALDPVGPVLRELVERSIRVKADVVGADLREQGLREILNYGHTLAHAIEAVEQFRWRHGAAVSVGLVYAAEIARLAGILDERTAARHRAVLTSLGLPVTYDAAAWPALQDAMRVDKKSRGSMLRFVLLRGLGEPFVFEAPDATLLEQAYAEVAS
ncbi:MAG: 3-dehydroquinate synthase [Frankiales bacterium]|jgi:3-dehydroquinate synthase|nr:3-dehydroquinate synthase [Frankiales bacterium]